VSGVARRPARRAERHVEVLPLVSGRELDLAARQREQRAIQPRRVSPQFAVGRREEDLVGEIRQHCRIGPAEPVDVERLGRIVAGERGVDRGGVGAGERFRQIVRLAAPDQRLELEIVRHCMRMHGVTCQLFACP
jgi:hypothetical protein